MAAFFLLLAVLIGVVAGDAVLENTGNASIVLFNRTFDQLTFGQLLLVFAGLGLLFALFLVLAAGSSRGRRTRRKERRAARRDLQGQVDELERENARLRQEVDRRDRVARLDDEGPVPIGTSPGGTAQQPRPADATGRTAEGRPVPPPGAPAPLSVRRERADDREEPVAPLRRDSPPDDRYRRS